MSDFVLTVVGIVGGGALVVVVVAQWLVERWIRRLYRNRIGGHLGDEYADVSIAHLRFWLRRGSAGPEDKFQRRGAAYKRQGLSG